MKFYSSSIITDTWQCLKAGGAKSKKSSLIILASNNHFCRSLKKWKLQFYLNINLNWIAWPSLIIKPGKQTFFFFLMFYKPNIQINLKSKHFIHFFSFKLFGIITFRCAFQNHLEMYETCPSQVSENPPLLPSPCTVKYNQPNKGPRQVKNLRGIPNTCTAPGLLQGELLANFLLPSVTACGTTGGLHFVECITLI